jgi:hypothetical protein
MVISKETSPFNFDEKVPTAQISKEKSGGGGGGANRVK